MSTPENLHREQESRIQRQVAFASGLFQGDVTIRTLLESLAEGVVIIDSHGTILLVNNRAEEMFGYSKKELVGLPHGILLPERLREIHEGHVAHFFEEPTIRPMGQLLDLVGRRKDGGEIPVEISLSFLETINGRLALAFISDISHRKEVERNLRESEERFRILVDGVKDYAIFMLDAGGNVLTWNSGGGSIMGYRPEEISGRHFSCFYPPEERESGGPEEELGMAQREGRFEAERWRVRKDGRRFWADVVLSALYDSNGNLCGFSKVVRDITARKRSEEEIEALNAELSARAADLERANTDLEAFNAAVSHDLKTPLSNINGVCQVLLALHTDRLDEAGSDLIRDIHSSTLRMSELINTFLGFSRLSHCTIVRQTASLSQMANKIATELSTAEPARRVTFRIAEGIDCEGDPALLRAVLDNLLGNAWKYSSRKEDAVIEFGMTEHEGKPAYFVRDNGQGFDMARAERLFTPFYRLPDQGEFTGHGIGLATVQRIVSRHGGRVWAESEQGKGATFYFTLKAD
jgi:PAS domain S-box-containing protein